MNAFAINTYGIKAAGGQMRNSLCRGLKKKKTMNLTTVHYFGNKKKIFETSKHSRVLHLA
jgi:hypothetical protein